VKDQLTESTVLIVDRWEDMQGRMLSMLLKEHRQDRVVMVIGGRNGLAAYESERPDLIFMYIHAGNPDATGFCPQVEVPVVVWGAVDPRQVYPDLKSAGAAGYLVQPSSAEEVLAARDVVLNGGTYYPPLADYVQDA
jgi:DNA-binding NarL/FixJ family response regulator